MKAPTMRPLTISLSPQQLEKLSAAVESGSYASNSEVIRDALRLWEQREELRQSEIERLRVAYREGIESGAPVDGEAAFAYIRSAVFGDKKA